MLAALVFYCIWLWLLMRSGLIVSDTSNPVAAALLLAPLLPVAAFDLWLRITWELELPTLYAFLALYAQARLTEYYKSGRLKLDNDEERKKYLGAGFLLKEAFGKDKQSESPEAKP